MVTVHQVAQSVAGALEKNRAGNCYPIGYYNMTWKEMLAIFHHYMRQPNKKVITIPSFMYTMGSKKLMKEHRAHNIDAGLQMVKFTNLQCSKLFIDKSLGCDFLGVTEDDIDQAIGESTKLCLSILDGEVKTLSMKGE